MCSQVAVIDIDEDKASGALLSAWFASRGGLGSLSGGSKIGEAEGRATAKTPRTSHYLAITT